MPTVEGFTPSVLWTTMYGLLALCVLFILVYRVYDAVHTIVERKRHTKESERPDFAEQVSQKVIEKLEPRFKEIERKLKTDNSRLDDHEIMITGIRGSQIETRDGLVAICKYLMAMAQYGDVGGNSKEMKDATAEMTRYLATKIGGSGGVDQG